MPARTPALPTIHLSPPALSRTLARRLRTRHAVCVHGPVGIGKSSIARDLACLPEVAHVETLYLLHRDPTDFGLPVPDVPSGTVRMLVPAWLSALIDMAKANPDKLFVILWDELNRAALSLQNVAARAILENVLGDAPLPPNIRHVACVNDAQDSAGTTPMPEHLRNRFIHLYLWPDFEGWQVWALHHIREEVISYLHKHPEHLHVCLFDDTTRAQYRNADAFPSPRVWEFVSDSLEDDQPAEDERATIAGAVGVPVAQQFGVHLQTFRTLVGRYNIPDILANPGTHPVPGPREISENYAIAAALARLATPQTANAVGTYLARLPAEFAALGVLALRRRDPALLNCPSLAAWQVAHADAF